jgi:hypothetical protein
MPETNLMIGNASNSRLTLEPTQIGADGGTTYPRLTLPLSFYVSPIPLGSGLFQNFDILSVQCHLYLKIPNQKIAVGTIPFMQYRVRHANLSYTANMEFPLDLYRIEKIEETRNGDLKCKIDVTILYGLYKTIHLQQEGKVMPMEVLADFDQRYQSFDFDIPQSHWTSKILPQLGYGTVKIVEIPMTDRIIGEEFKKSVSELVFAQQYFEKGDYDKSVGHCRSALETIHAKLIDLKSFIKSDSEYDWVEEIATSTTNWLNKIYEKTYRLTNKPHHPPTVGHFSRYDADAIMLVVTALVSYVSRLSIKE